MVNILMWRDNTGLLCRTQRKSKTKVFWQKGGDMKNGRNKERRQRKRRNEGQRMWGRNINLNK
jgi:hypothetical protein